MKPIKATSAIGLMAFTIASIVIICGLMADSYYLLKIKTIGLVGAFAFAYLRSGNRPKSSLYSFVVIYCAWALMLFVVGLIPASITLQTQEYLFYLVPALVGVYILLLPRIGFCLGYRIDKDEYSPWGNVFFIFTIAFLMGIYVFQ